LNGEEDDEGGEFKAKLDNEEETPSSKEREIAPAKAKAKPSKKPKKN